MGVAVLAQATFGLVAVLISRWAFRSWPTGAFTRAPGLVGVAGILLVIGLSSALGARGLAFGLVAATWIVGRLLGAIAAAVIPGVGIDAALLASASFGLLSRDGGRVVLGAPTILPLLAQLTVLFIGQRWGSRKLSRDGRHGEQA